MPQKHITIVKNFAKTTIILILFYYFEIITNERKNTDVPLIISYNIRKLRLNVRRMNRKRADEFVSIHAIRVLKN